MKRFLLLVTVLTAAPAQAYEILESHYRVETSPGVLEDQLVLRCDDGRKLTVSWEARLSEACGEVAYSDHGGGGARAEAGQAQEVDASQAKEKEIVLSRAREQNPTIDERHLKFQPKPDGLDVQFSPQTREILKRYELCRKQTKGSPLCASERDQALGKLSAPAANAAAPATQTAPASAVKAAAAERTTTPTQAAPETPAPPAPSPAALDAAEERAAAEQKIAENYTSCMRAKPRFECEQARASALKSLDNPKGKARTTTGKARTDATPHSVATK